VESIAKLITVGSVVAYADKVVIGGVVAYADKVVIGGKSCRSISFRLCVSGSCILHTMSRRVRGL
jgi:UDP-3-O-[3-hydroxymyristoyl] glucosamine N-acyltransferase